MPGVLAPGTSKTFPAALGARRYVLVCHLPGHYLAGVRTALIVAGHRERPGNR
jgi:uncharacterized cupredoxin-like copper-binding protein